MHELALDRRGSNFKYIKGSVIDIGGGFYPIGNLYEGITEFRSWDWVDGDAQYMEGCKKYDTVYSASCLEHMVDPYIALQNWINIANKYIVVVIPDEEMYEKNHWPSIYNADHKWSFTLESTSTLPKSINVYTMLRAMKGINVIKVERITQGWDPKDLRDLTVHGAECSIDIILEKVENAS